jgi:hypothetical protein
LGAFFLLKSSSESYFGKLQKRLVAGHKAKSMAMMTLAQKVIMSCHFQAIIRYKYLKEENAQQKYATYLSSVNILGFYVFGIDFCAF